MACVVNAGIDNGVMCFKVDQRVRPRSPSQTVTNATLAERSFRNQRLQAPPQLEPNHCSRRVRSLAIPSPTSLTSRPSLRTRRNRLRPRLFQLWPPPRQRQRHFRHRSRLPRRLRHVERNALADARQERADRRSDHVLDGRAKRIWQGDAVLTTDPAVGVVVFDLAKDGKATSTATAVPGNGAVS